MTIRIQLEPSDLHANFLMVALLHTGAMANILQGPTDLNARMQVIQGTERWGVVAILIQIELALTNIRLHAM